MATQLKVLLADDINMHRTILRTSVCAAASELGYALDIVNEAENGSQLVDFYRNTPQGSIDFVFSDIRMPTMDGLTALVKILSINQNQKMVMVSSEDTTTMDLANKVHGEEKRKTLEQSQAMELLEKVASRIRDGVEEKGKTNSILIGCEKLALDPIWVAQQFGARGYLRKPYDPVKTKEIFKFVLSSSKGTFLAKV